MSHPPGASPQAGPAGEANDPAQAAPAAAQPLSPEHLHNFDVQKDVHRQIRNDPDYDDWENGTEPLPHEAWSLKKSQPSD